jgi:hypothetical protein
MTTIAARRTRDSTPLPSNGSLRVCAGDGALSADASAGAPPRPEGRAPEGRAPEGCVRRAASGGLRPEGRVRGATSRGSACRSRAGATFRGSACRSRAGATFRGSACRSRAGATSRGSACRSRAGATSRGSACRSRAGATSRGSVWEPRPGAALCMLCYRSLGVGIGRKEWGKPVQLLHKAGLKNRILLRHLETMSG